MPTVVSTAQIITPGTGESKGDCIKRMYAAISKRAYIPDTPGRVVNVFDNQDGERSDWDGVTLAPGDIFLAQTIPGAVTPEGDAGSIITALKNREASFPGFSPAPSNSPNGFQACITGEMSDNDLVILKAFGEAAEVREAQNV